MSGPAPAAARAFRRPSRAGGRQLLGVCAGLARRWHVAPATVRGAFVITLLPFGAGLLLYLALALVMPADDAEEQSARWRGEVGRTLLHAALGLAGLVLFGAVATLSVVLTIFGLGGAVLVLASAALAAVILVERRRVLWTLGPLTVALAVPGSVAALTGADVARQFGTEVVTISQPSDAAPAGYRAGTGDLLVDLRDFVADPGTTTTIRARADLGRLVVALPSDRCLNVEIEHRHVRTVLDDWHENALLRQDAGGPAGALSDQVQPPIGPAGTLGVRNRSHRSTLLAFGRRVQGPAGTYRRTLSQPGIPTVRLALVSSRKQMVVRDFPTSVGPLSDPRWPESAGRPRLDVIPVLQRSVGERQAQFAARAGESGNQLAKRLATENAAAADTLRWSNTASLRAFARLVRATRARLAYPQAQAQRLLGPCASAAKVRAAARQLAAADPEHGLAAKLLALLTRSPPTVVPAGSVR